MTEDRYKMQDGPSIDGVAARSIHRMYTALGHDQSLERINERGGFGWGEVAYMYRQLRGKIGQDALDRLVTGEKE